MKAFGTHVIIKPLHETLTESGLILLPEDDSADYLKGEIISVGDGNTHSGKREMNVSVGEVVIFDAGGAMKIKTPEGEVRVTDISNIKYAITQTN